MNTCSYPVRDGEPCRKKAVAVYTDKNEKMYRCRIHDGRTAKDWAEEHGIIRYDLNGVAA